MFVIVLIIIFMIAIFIFIIVQLSHLTKKMISEVKDSPSTDQPSIIRKKPFSSYTVFYIEASGVDVTSCEITQLAALRVREGYGVNTFCAHVSPTGDIPDTAAQANQFNESTVVSVPTLKPALESFLEFIGNDLLIGYNIASSDLPLLQRNLSIELNKKLSNSYIDVYQMAMAANLPVNDNQLASLAEYFKLSVDNVHDTLAHCHTTKKMFRPFIENGVAFG